MWYKQAESLMNMQKITNPAFHLVLVQCVLPDALQEWVAHKLEANILASEAYSQLKAELTWMHKKTSLDQLAKGHGAARGNGAAQARGPRTVVPMDVLFPAPLVDPAPVG